MNLIEAFNKSNDGQYIRRHLGQIKYQKKTMGFFSMIENVRSDAYNNNGAHQIDFDLLANDWQIVKEPKKVVIEEIEMVNREGWIVPVSDGRGFFNPDIDPEKILNKPLMKMTLEWEE